MLACRRCHRWAGGRSAGRLKRRAPPGALISPRVARQPAQPSRWPSTSTRWGMSACPRATASSISSEGCIYGCTRKTCVPDDGSEELGALAFQLEEKELALGAADVVAEPAVLGDDPVARDDDRNGILAQDRAHFLETFRPARSNGDLLIAPRPAVRDLARLAEHAADERGGAADGEIELHVELAPRAGEVLRQPAEDLVERFRAFDEMEGREGARLRRLDDQTCQRRAPKLQAQGSDGRGHQHPEELRRALRHGSDPRLGFHGKRG